MDIGEFREVLDEARQKADFAATELGDIRHGAHVDEQYKLDRVKVTEADAKAVWDAADAFALAVASLHDRTWGRPE